VDTKLKVFIIENKDLTNEEFENAIYEASSHLTHGGTVEDQRLQIVFYPLKSKIGIEALSLIDGGSVGIVKLKSLERGITGEAKNPILFTTESKYDDGIMDNENLKNYLEYVFEEYLTTLLITEDDRLKPYLEDEKDTKK